MCTIHIIHTYLPANWVLPIQIKTVEIVFFQELNCLFDEPLSGSRIIH